MFNASSHQEKETGAAERDGAQDRLAPREEARVWERVRRRLRAELGDDIFTSWFARLELVSVSDGLAQLSVPTRFLRSWLVGHYADRIEVLYREENPAVQRIAIALREAGARTAPRKAAGAPHQAGAPSGPAAATATPASLSLTPAVATRSDDSFESSPLDRRLTFASFHVGRSNMMAHAAAMQVVQAQPGQGPVYNPLFVHSAVGMGKTHLLQATAQAVSGTDRRVIYLTAEKFMYGFVASLRAQTALSFKENLRAIDVLVIDDAQFLNGKQTQQEFCHTLNALIDAGKQVIVAADRNPADLDMLDERIQSRLAGGLVVEIGPLDEALRLRVLESRIQTAKAHLPAFHIGSDVLAHVARCVTANGRDLEGAVNRLLAHATLGGGPLDLETAEVAIKDLIRTQEPKRVKIEDIQRLVANHYSVSRADILSSRRTATVVRPRQIAMYLSKTLTLRSLPEIGRRFGGRDHTTVLHAVRKIDGLIGTDISLAGEIDHLRRMLQE
ncbi:MAG TPA: chromosomal replication initiator protein DnaA [Beijerinckiaceae bacterium]|nr:chromosomal replication initiator protein DnaA [Beijerinckiaceae bacterium]